MSTLGKIEISILSSSPGESTTHVEAHVDENHWQGGTIRALAAVGFSALRRTIAEQPEEHSMNILERNFSDKLQIQEDEDGKKKVDVMLPTVSDREVTGESDDEDESTATNPVDLFNLRGRNIFRNQYRINKLYVTTAECAEKVFVRMKEVSSASDQDLVTIYHALKKPPTDFSELLSIADDLDGLAHDAGVSEDPFATRIRTFVESVTTQPLPSPPPEPTTDQDAPE